MRVSALTHEFVESAPANLEDGKLYVSITYATVLHKCCCGCRNEVVTPLSPTDWRVTFDGESISLYPSIGNWGLPCGSHYWIDRNKVRWAGRWSPDQIEEGRAADVLARKIYFDDKAATADAARESARMTSSTAIPRQGLWSSLRQWWSRFVG